MSFSYAYVVLIVLVVFALHQLFFRPLFWSPLRKLPGPPFGHWFYGQSQNMLRPEALTLQSEWVEKYGTILRAITWFGIEQVMFSSPNALQRILVSEWTDYPRPDFMRNLLGMSAGYGLLTVTGSVHKQMRRAINPAFSLANIIAQMDMYYPPIDGLVKILYDRIAEQKDRSAGAQVPMYDWLSKVTLDIICETAFGYHADSVHNSHNELALAYHKLMDLQNGRNITHIIGLVSIPGVPRFLRTDFAYRYRDWLFHGPIAPTKTFLSSMHCVKAVARAMLTEKLAEVDVHDAQSKRDIMSLLIRARMEEKEDGYKMSDQDLVEQVLTFLFAGHETTASGLSWALWLLANAPEEQEKLRAEVTPLVAREARPGYHGLKECVWLDCVIMEVLRLMPPAPMTIRKAGKSDWVDGVYIPKGTLLYIPIRAINTYSHVWGADAQEFRPARWLSLPSTYNPTFSLFSFITGPHACIGRTMGILEMKAVLAVLVAHFTFAPGWEGQVARTVGGVSTKPEGDMPLRIKPVGVLPVPTQ